MAVTEPDGTVTGYSYDVLDNLMGVASPPGGQCTRCFGYDSMSRLTSATNPESGTVNYTYDKNGNAIQRTDAKQNITCAGDAPVVAAGDSVASCPGTNAYDGLNRPLSTTCSASSTLPVIYKYDQSSKGALSSVFDQTGCTVGSSGALSNCTANNGVSYCVFRRRKSVVPS